MKKKILASGFIIASVAGMGLLSTPAQAATVTGGAHNVNSGNSILVAVGGGGTTCGNAVAIFGVANASCTGGTSASNTGVGNG